MIERLTVLFLLVAGSSLAPFLTANTGGSEAAAETCLTAECQKAQAQRHQIRQETANQETDNKIREMANETYINRVKTSDKHQ